MNAEAFSTSLAKTGQFVFIEAFNPHVRRVRRWKVVCGGLLTAALAQLACMAQVSLTNGWPNQGTIQVAGSSNVWTLSASAGDRVTLQVAKTSGGAGFSPSLEVFTPNGRSMGTRSGGVAARLDLQATETGGYSVVVKDTTSSGTGTYQLQLAQVPGAFTLPPGDEGGSLTNGANQQGVINVGDLDLWTVSANAGDRLTVQLGELTGGASFTPMIEIFGPDGAQLAIGSGSTAARASVQAQAAGTYVILVSDSALTGAGTYEMHLAQMPGTFVVPEGDEGGTLATGVDTDGTIGMGDLDLWTFNADAGERIVLQITELTGGVNFAPRIELFGPGSETKATAQNASAATIDSAMETGGTYGLLVSDANQNGTGTYRLRLTRSTIGPPASNILTNGATQTGAIIAGGLTNVWSFTASAGEAVVVRAGEISQTGTFTPRLRLFGPNGAQLAVASGASAVEVAVNLTNSGTFSLAVDNASTGTGTFRLSLAKTGSPLSIAANDEGGALTNGTVQIASIDLGDLDAWVFTSSPGENIIVRMGEITASLSPQLRLYGPNGALLDSSSGATATKVTARATNAGTFLVVAGDLSSGYVGTGNYALTMTKTGNPLLISDGDEGGALTNGATYVASIELGDVDPWSFIANAGESIVVRVGESSASLTPQLRLYGPNGALLDSGSGAVAGEVSVRSTNSGRFLVAVSDLSSGYAGSGNYRLSLARTAVPLITSANDEGGVLTNGTTYLGSIEVGDLDAWAITAFAGESMVIRMGEISGALSPELRLYGPNGALLDSSWGAVAAEVTARATNSGTFLLVADDLSSGYAGSGNYRLSLAKTGSAVSISANDEGDVITNGTTHLGGLETGDIDAWMFTAKAGEIIVARMGETSAASSLAPYLRLYGPSGALLDAGNGTVAAEVSGRATNSGSFLLVAGDLSSGFAGSGNYRLTLVKSGEPLLISAGDEGGGMTGDESYDGMIDAGDIDAWTFSIRAGEHISISATELVSGSPLSPELRLYGRDGSLLRSFSGATVAQFSAYPAPTNGTYLVVVSDLSSGYAGTGTYRLNVNRLSDTVKLYPPILRTAGVNLLSVGGAPGTSYTVLTTTDVSMLPNLWSPLTNYFDTFGVGELITAFGSEEPKRFFRLSRP